ncbi:MAG: kinase [Acidobacteria bacterium]|nr:kinase [Acidobacteriota bacterium]
MIISRTPLRISFFGGGTDYPLWFHSHRGAVLATTIDKYIYVSCRYLPPFFDHRVRISYSKTELANSASEIEHPSVRECMRFLGVESNAEIHTDADLPARTGLGSSSSFTVGLLHTLHAHKGQLATKMQLAQEAIHVEQELIGENVGCQDQILAAFGGLNRIEFKGKTEHSVAPIPLPSERLAQFEQHLMLFYTGISRMASAIVAEQLSRLEEKEKELGEMYRLVEDGVKELTANNSLSSFGKLLHESWMLKRSLSSQITNPLVDEAYAVGHSMGAYGGKLLGAGGGGFLLLFADPACQPRIRERLSKLLYVPVALESTGSQIIFYQPGYQNNSHSRTTPIQNSF